MYTRTGVQAYRETDIQSMTREKMIVLLYEKIVSNLNEAKAATERGDRVAMTKRINHSQRIIGELRSALDHSIGGDISRNLDSLYDFMFHELLEMVIDQDSRHVDNCIRVITPLLDAWRSVPVGTGEKAARDHARGLLKVPGGPENATEELHPPSQPDSSQEGATPGSVADKPELVSVSA